MGTPAPFHFYMFQFPGMGGVNNRQNMHGLFQSADFIVSD